MDVVAILVMWPGLCGHFLFPHIWNLSLIGLVVSEEKLFENVDGRTDAGVTGKWYTINSPMSLWLRWWAKNISYTRLWQVLASKF